MSGMFKKILVANRGEIAVRVIRACRELGITSAAVFSEADRTSLHVRLADEAYPIGPAPSQESYLCLEKLVDVARRTGCDALHPGYGFLAENPNLPHACEAFGITFIGPSAEAMEAMGSKTAARQLARRVDIPTVPGAFDPIGSLEDAAAFGQTLGFPVVLKAIAGGGGKGMRVVAGPEELSTAWSDAAAEAMATFGDPRLYLEKYLDRPRHVEIQILADQHGRVVSLGERECSIQRRHQKIIEEAPSPIMTAELRRQMGDAAVRLARAGGYVNAGTVEFLVDAQLNFYFLEVNTRLQVEHPVTEQVTGLDAVKLQIAIAAGHRLPFAWESITPRGHAIECRIYAEDPENNFFPSPGTVVFRRTPQGPGVRVDDGVYAGWTIPAEYDPLLGKIIAWGNSREESLARLRRALDEYVLSGIKTNVNLFRRILVEPEFVRGEVHTRWLDELMESRLAATAQAVADDESSAAPDAAFIAAAFWHHRQEAPAKHALRQETGSRWKLEGRQTDRTP
jgi:acetyl-CoA carboxylase biotin carboxylase subunit